MNPAAFPAAVCRPQDGELGDDCFLLEPGDTISIPTGVWHQARVVSETDAEMVICFSSADRITEMDDETRRPTGLR